MRRVVLGGPDLAGFTSASFDDHVKLFLPPPGSPAVLPDITPDGPRFADGIRPAARDFTPRAHDPHAGSLTIDFALHDAGPATDWAAAATQGSQLVIGGPRGSAVIPFGFDWHLLIGDETALPAIGRRLAELPPDCPSLSLILVDSKQDEIELPEHAAAQIVWVHRDGAAKDDATPLLAALTATPLPPGDYFAWVAAESGIAKQLRAHLLERGARREWVKAAGYWRTGAVSVHDKLED